MNIDNIINHLGGTAATQILLGVGPSAVSNYRMRGAFPEYARVKIWQALKARGIHVDPETLNIPETLESSECRLTPPKPPSLLLIISGGIAAYKALELIRRSKDKGWHVQVILTKSGAEFITPLSVSALSGKKTYTDLFSLNDEAEMGHIKLARGADLVVIAPATANIIARITQGMADDLATTAVLATNAPILIAPAMNPFMWGNAATQNNVAQLQARGVRFIGPDHGDTACGEDGTGRFAETMAILEAAEQILMGRGRLMGKRVVITSGPTHEAIDGVRYIANRSSGKQGHAIAAALIRAGANVHLISGPVNLSPPVGVSVTHVTTAREMLAASEAALPADVMIAAAAVADWRVADSHVSEKKIKKYAAPPQLNLTENPDILAIISRHSARPQLVIGFAAETENVASQAADKLKSKGCDWILANDVSGGADSVFGDEDNEICFITSMSRAQWPRMTKTDVAERLTAAIVKELADD